MFSWSSRIATGGKEPIVVFSVNSAGVLLVDKTDLKIHIRRLSDNFYFDWQDNTFKTVASVLMMLMALKQVDKTYSPGEYQLDTSPNTSHVLGFDTLSILNVTPDETYYVTAVQDGGSDISGLPHVGEIKVGDYIDDIGTGSGTVEDRYPVIF